MNRFYRNRGFSLVELLLSMALLVFLIASGFLVWKSIMQSSVSSQVQSRVNEKLRTVSAMIQNEAVENFDTMTETNRDRTGFTDPDIRIVSTISAVDANDRTRLVTLQAVYNVTPTNSVTKTTTFRLSNILGGISGASVRVRLVSRETSSPIANILVSAPGKTVPLVSGLTDLNGECRLYGVLESSPTMRVTLDGEGVNSYPLPPFPAPGYPTYKKYVNAFNIQTGEQRDLGEHVYVRPANATVRVLDASTNLPVPNVEVRMVPQAAQVPIGTCTNAGSNCWMGGGFLGGFIGTTGNDGRVTFTNLLEGPYYPYVVGNSVYAASDKMGTSPGNNNSRDPQCGLISEGTVNCGDLRTIRKGSLKVSVKAVVYNDDGEYLFKEPMAQGATVQFSINNDQSYLYHPSNSSRIANFNWNGALARNLVTSGLSMHTAQLDSNGEYIFNFIAPRIINSSHTLPSSSGAERQGVEGTFLVGHFYSSPTFSAQITPAPYLPVAVRHIGKDKTKPQFIVEYSNILNYPIVKTLPSTSLIGDYNKILFSNGLTSSNADFEVGVLQYQPEMMARARGVIRGSGPNAITSNFVGTVQIREGTGQNFGSAAISFNTTLGAYFAERGKWVVTISSPDLTPGTFKHVFTFPDLLPTLESDRQEFEFLGIPSAPTSHPSTTFWMPVIVYSKDINGTPIQLTSPSFPTALLNLTFRYWQAGNQIEPPTTQAYINNGFLEFQSQRTTYSNDQWTALIPAQELRPGIETVFPDFNNATRSSTRRRYYVTSDSNNELDFVPLIAGMGYTYDYNSGQNRYQPFDLPSNFHYMRFAQRAITHLHGIVKTVGGAGIVGATVNLSGHGFQAMQTTSGVGGWFHFPPTGGESNTFSFSLTNAQHNLTISASHPNYVSSGNVGIVTGMPIQNPFVVDVVLNASGSGGGL